MTTLFDTNATLVAALKVLNNHLDEYREVGLTGEMPPVLAQVVSEYQRLAEIKHRSESDEDRLDAILLAAQENEILSFWLTEVDHILGEEEGLLDQASYELYLNEHAALVERLGLKGADFPVLDSPSTLFELGVRENFKRSIEKELYHTVEKQTDKNQRIRFSWLGTSLSSDQLLSIDLVMILLTRLALR
jgi:hypothetical protein